MPEPIVTPAPAAPAAGAPAAPAAKPAEGNQPGAPAEPTYKVKVNGKEETWTQAQLIERGQKSAGAEEAMKKADALDKAFTNFVSSAQDPEKLLGLLQHPSLKYDDAKQEVLVTKLLSSKNPKIITAVKRWLWENEIQPATMDPKERELAELRAAKAQYEREATERKTQEEQTARQIAVTKKWNEYRVSIGEALKAEGLPQAEGVVARVARYALLQSRANKPVDISEAVKRVKADLGVEYDERFKSLTEDNILDHIPAGIAELINKAFLKRVKGGAPAAGKSAEPAKDERPFEEVLRDINRGKKVFQE